MVSFRDDGIKALRRRLLISPVFHLAETIQESAIPSSNTWPDYSSGQQKRACKRNHVEFQQVVQDF